MLQDQIDRSKSSNDFVRNREVIVIPDLCQRIGLVSGYDDVKAHTFSRVLKRPTREGIVVCSDASVLNDIRGVAGVGFIAYTEHTHNLVGYGHAMLTHDLGKGFSSRGAETLGMAIAAYAMRDFAGVMTCDNESSVNNFNRACRHTHMAEIARWGKGHADSLGNLIADYYAKMALHDIKDLAPSLGQPRLINWGKATMTPRLWQEKVLVDQDKDRRVKVSGSSRYVRRGPGVANVLRTALVHTPCLESPLQHSFMIVGMRDEKIVSIESGILSSDSDHQGWAEHVPLFFMRHIQKRYANPEYSSLRQITVSPYVRRFHDAGMRDAEREILEGTFDMGPDGYANSLNPTIRLAGMMDGIRETGIRFSVEKTLRGSSIEQWDHQVRRGIAPIDKLENTMAKNPLRPRWKRFGDEAGYNMQHMETRPILDPPAIDLSSAPQPDTPTNFHVSSKSAFKMGY